MKAKHITNLLSRSDRVLHDAVVVVPVFVIGSVPSPPPTESGLCPSGLATRLSGPSSSSWSGLFQTGTPPQLGVSRGKVLTGVFSESLPSVGGRDRRRLSVPSGPPCPGGKSMKISSPGGTPYPAGTGAPLPCSGHAMPAPLQLTQCGGTSK